LAAGAGSELAGRFGLDSAAAGRLDALIDGVVEAEWAPTAVRERVDVRDRHLADSLVALKLPAVREAGRIADLGAGAGFPGLALAAALPGAEVVLVESTGRKAKFISELAASAGIVNAHAIPLRAEEWREGLETCDVVTARALAALPVVLEYAAPLLREGGTTVACGGRRDPVEEADGAAAAVELGLDSGRVHQVSPFTGSTDRHLHAYVKLAPTPAQFPRRAGVARKRPLRRVT
jgi:16S rRNA (guanine527-N7)-methyltransferase